MMKLVSTLLLMGYSLQSATQIVALPSKSPLVTFRFVFRTGSAYDSAGQEGIAALTAKMLSGGGTKLKTYKQIVDAMYPMAASVSSQTDKEMVTFSGVTHVDNLEAYYQLFREMLLEPGWRTDDFTRLRDDQLNVLRVNLRGNNDEELGKEVLYNEIYSGHPYGHYNAGSVSALEKLAIADLQKFYKTHFTRANLIIGVAGGYPDGFVKRVEKDFEKLEKGTNSFVKLSEPRRVEGLRMTMVEKQTRSVAYSLGFSIPVKRGDPDYVALLAAQSYLGQHRSSGGLLYNHMREERGLNYGDYAYIEYFPFGMFRIEPSPNLARRQQIFQIWIRPVEPPTAHFALRLAMFEFERFVKDGVDQESFDRTTSFLSKYVNLLMKTKSAQLGYKIDSLVYGIPDYDQYVKSSLAKLTRDDVNRAIRKHLHPRNMEIVTVAQNCAALKEKLLSGAASPMQYNSPKPDKILAEDKVIEKLDLGLKAEAIRIVPVENVFQ